MAGRPSPKDIDFVQTYDDYPVISLMQLEDLGFCGKGEGPDAARHSFTHDGTFPAQHFRRAAVGRAGGAAGGFLGMVEAIRQLTGEAGERLAGALRRARERLA